MYSIGENNMKTFEMKKEKIEDKETKEVSEFNVLIKWKKKDIVDQNGKKYYGVLVHDDLWFTDDQKQDIIDVLMNG